MGGLGGCVSRSVPVSQTICQHRLRFAGYWRIDTLRFCKVPNRAGKRGPLVRHALANLPLPRPRSPMKNPGRVSSPAGAPASLYRPASSRRTARPTRPAKCRTPRGRPVLPAHSSARRAPDTPQPRPDTLLDRRRMTPAPRASFAIQSAPRSPLASGRERIAGPLLGLNPAQCPGRMSLPCRGPVSFATEYGRRRGSYGHRFHRGRTAPPATLRPGRGFHGRPETLPPMPCPTIPRRRLPPLGFLSGMRRPGSTRRSLRGRSLRSQMPGRRRWNATSPGRTTVPPIARPTRPRPRRNRPPSNRGP